MFWWNITSRLKEWVFKINPYDYCVENKTVNGKQLTVVWHVDYLKIYHMESDAVEEIIAQLSEQYGKDTDLTFQRGKVHKYMGVWLYYRMQVKVKIDMTEYLKNVLQYIPEKHKGRVVMPATNHLFEVENMAKNISEDVAQIFHTIMINLLFLRKQAWHNILIRVAFLKIRVRDPDEDDDK